MKVEDIEAGRIDARATHTSRHLSAAETAALDLAAALGAFNDAVIELARMRRGAGSDRDLESRLQAQVDIRRAETRAAIVQLHDELVFVQALTGPLDDLV
ncbi:MAG TPA: hypothetical protein PLD23_14510 [Armatimonadota bacterium]|nr:hypothetical protein [Armatimonadota bacterium]